MIIDTHAHYDDEQFDEDREEILGKMQDAGIGMIMDAGSTILSWDKIVKLTEEYPFVYGAIGVHPDEVGNLDETQFARMERLLDKEKIKAVGEIGLDYYWDKENHDLQKEWFIRQLDLARKKEKPVIIHTESERLPAFPARPQCGSSPYRLLSSHFRSLREADKFSLFHTDSLSGTPGSHTAVLLYK